MQKYIILLSLIFFLNCNFIEPSYLFIQNDSNYTIRIIINQDNHSNKTIEKNNGDFLLVYPGKIVIKIMIDEIGYNENQVFQIKYLEKKRLIFNVND
jgi:hypothetical protein